MQKFIQREYIKFANRVIERSYDERADVFDTMEMAEMEFTRISEMISTGRSEMSWADALAAIPKRVEFLTNNQGEVIGVPSGLSKLDKFFGGWQNSDLIIIGARPGMGKTALTVKFMLAAAQANYPVGFVSMEMSAIQLATLAIVTGKLI